MYRSPLSHCASVREPLKRTTTNIRNASAQQAASHPMRTRRRTGDR